jgi:alkylation response protein AidB-like acyl-CoA dehydrogenase
VLAPDPASGAGHDRHLPAQIGHLSDEITTLDFQLTPEQELIRSAAREFAEREITPYARDWDRAEEIDRGLVPKLADAGFLGAGWSEDYGGSGLDTVSYALLVEELGKADSSVRGIVSVNNGLVGKTIARFGTDEQKRNWLPKLASGDALGCYALTEPGCGSDAAALQTRAERDGDRWRLTGSKIFITLGAWASVALVFARTGGEGPRGISCLLVPTGGDGFAARPIKGKLGLRAQDTSELTLDGVEVGDDALLGELNGGFRVAMSALDVGRISLAAGCVGIAQGCLDASIRYAREREAFGRPIAGFQLVQELIADTAVETEAARLLVWRAAALADSASEHTLESSMAKLYASEVAVRAANAAVQVHGGYGYIDEYPVGKYLRDARVATLYEGTSQIQKLILGRALTGTSAFV